MNKQELIEKINGIATDTPFANAKIVDHSEVIELIKQLDEAQKVTIPQFVAEYIEFKRKYDFHVYGAMRKIEDHYDKRVPEWFYEGNIETFIRAWLDGYEVEEEKRYTVKIKGMDKDFTMLKLDEIKGGWYLGSDTEFSYTKNTHTRKELKQAGFGWVFDCAGIEIEEVEDE